MSSAPVISNRKAYHDFHIFEKMECGIELVGAEVKSLREGKASLTDSFARVDGGEIFLHNTHISQYEKTGSFKTEPRRIRKLLLRKRQISKLAGEVSQKGLTLVPLKIYFNQRGLAKVELAVARGKRAYDKRETLKKRESELEIKRAMRRR